MGRQKYRLSWKGKEVGDALVPKIAAGLGDVALEIEGNAKKELKAGHGLITGTLRRSIHAAEPGYPFHTENVKPGPLTPERGGMSVSGIKVGNAISVLVGSGMIYARKIENLYAYMLKGFHNALPRVPEIMGRRLK